MGVIGRETSDEVRKAPANELHCGALYMDIFWMRFWPWRGRATTIAVVAIILVTIDELWGTIEHAI